MEIRDFQNADSSACLKVFDSNVPEYFHIRERALFVECLESSAYLPPRLHKAGGPPGSFYVVADKGCVVGCGGWYLDGDVAVLSWGMVTRALHRQGFGRFLLQERLNAIRKDGRAGIVRVRTTSPIQGFFERAGFKLVREGVNGLVDEMPLVELAREA